MYIKNKRKINKTSGGRPITRTMAFSRAAKHPHPLVGHPHTLYGVWTLPFFLSLLYNKLDPLVRIIFLPKSANEPIKDACNRNTHAPHAHAMPALATCTSSCPYTVVPHVRDLFSFPVHLP